MTRLIVAEIPQNAGRGLITACRDADVILTDYAPLTRTVIEQLHRCRLISVAGTGYSCVDLKAAADAKISVCAVDEYYTEEVADHAILLMLALCRRLLEYHDQVQTENRWQFDSLSGLPWKTAQYRQAIFAIFWTASTQGSENTFITRRAERILWRMDR